MAATPAQVVSDNRPFSETSIATVITTTNTTTSTTSSLSTATADIPTSVQNIIDNSPREGQEDDNDDNHIEGDHGSNERKQNSNSSLATGAGKLVGLAIAVPNAQISVPEGDQGHNQGAP